LDGQFKIIVIEEQTVRNGVEDGDRQQLTTKLLHVIPDRLLLTMSEMSVGTITTMAKNQI
jgi:hypothetical protein